MEETIEKQAMKNKPASVNAIKGSKGRGKAPTKKSPTAAKEPEKKCNRCTSNRHETKDCQSKFCDLCKRWFHSTENCRFNTNSPYCMPNYKTEDKNQSKPTATVNSIQRGQHSTSSYQAPPNLFHQERNQPHSNIYLPHSLVQSSLPNTHSQAHLPPSCSTWKKQFKILLTLQVWIQKMVPGHKTW